MRKYILCLLIVLNHVAFGQVHIANFNVSNSEVYFNILDLRLENITPFGNNGANGYNFKLKIIYEVTVTGTLENIYTLRGEFFCSNSTNPNHPRSFQLNKNQPFVGTYIDSVSTATITTTSTSFATDNFEDVGCLNFCIIYHSEGVKEQDFCANLNDVSFLNVEFGALNVSESKKENALLSWNTFTEKDSDYFTVSRSSDGKNWKSISKIKAQGTSTEESYYNFEDTSTQTGVYYYKLSVTDINGNTKDLGITSFTKIEQQIVSEVFPNPAEDDVSLMINSPSDLSLTAQIIDSKGMVIKEYETTVVKGSNKLTANISDLVPGIYFARINIPSIGVYEIKQIRVL